MSIQISMDEFVRFVRIEAGMELLNVYMSTEYPKEETIKKLLNHVMLGMPFSTPEESEDGWHE
jgi:hypothetical protein